MNEASVSSPWMSGIRKALPGAVVVKHRDASMIGLVDCSVTYKTHVLWAEFKLYDWHDRFSTMNNKERALWCLEDSTKKAPTQRETAEALSRASACLYIIWIKKTQVLVVEPVTQSVVAGPSTAWAIELVADLFREWAPVPPPFRAAQAL